MSEEKKKIRLFGPDSEPTVFDAEVKEIDGGFKILSMEKIGVWKDLEDMTPQELWASGYCPQCRVKLELTGDEPPFNQCPKCGGVG